MVFFHSSLKQNLRVAKRHFQFYLYECEVIIKSSYNSSFCLFSFLDELFTIEATLILNLLLLVNNISDDVFHLFSPLALVELSIH